MRPRADVTLQIAEIEYRLGSRTETLEELGTLNPHWRIDRLYAKTGVGTRRVAAPEETATGLAEDAARQLLERVDAASLDGLIHVTQSPESDTPDHGLRAAGTARPARLAARLRPDSGLFWLCVRAVGGRLADCPCPPVPHPADLHGPLHALHLAP